MKFSLLINMKIRTIVGIFIFISRENFMLSWGEHEKSFTTSGPGGRLWCLLAESMGTREYIFIAPDKQNTDICLCFCGNTMEISTVLLTSLGKMLFAWHFILNVNILFCPDNYTLSETICLFRFHVLFLNIYPKIKFMAKSWSYLCYFCC